MLTRYPHSAHTISAMSTRLRKLSVARRKVFASALIAAMVPSGAYARQDGAEGRWLTQGKSAVVEIYPCGDVALCGRLVWFRIEPTDPDPQTVDIHNPTPALRTRPLCGLVFMWDFQPDGRD